MRLSVGNLLPRLCLGAVFLLFAEITQAVETGYLEKAVCGLKEPFYFWLWQRAAGRADSRRIGGVEGVEEVSFRTIDGRTLRGYRLKAKRGVARDGQARGFLLVAPGNAMLADQVLAGFVPFARAGIDVYLYDYRGYGRSGGRSRLQAIVNDYRQISSQLGAGHYLEHLYYGMSFGGIVLLNALAGIDPRARLVVDSSPARLSNHGCPEAYDPVRHLPADAGSILFVVGGRDTVVPPRDSAELVEAGVARGAHVLRDPELNHPFMDGDPVAHERRMDAVRSFLLGGRESGTANQPSLSLPGIAQ
ncbi:MAG: alpha/beta hydrolase [Pseudomonadota bacterium]|nr:alpha/beta hydrolase [Pseudomonadota bacterium]